MAVWTLIFLLSTPLQAEEIAALRPGVWYQAEGVVREERWVINQDEGNELLWKLPAGATFPATFSACFQVLKPCQLRCELSMGKITEIKRARPFIPGTDGTFKSAGPDACR